MRHAMLATVLAIVCFWACSILASGMLIGDSADRLPSISELEKLRFMPAGAAAAPNLPYAEVSVVRGLFLAYDAGSEAVSKYRDPVLTRGASGITVFKAVSPAVVVVVVGSIKDDKFDPEGLAGCGKTTARPKMLSRFHDLCD